jgi:hypothetical protein
MVEEVKVEEERRMEPSMPPAPLAPRQRGVRGVTGAVLLIGFGVALLLDNLGIVNINWIGILQYWPVILILIGLDVIFGGRSALGSVVVALLALVLVFGVIFLAGQRSGPGFEFGASNAVTRPIAQELGDVNDLEVLLNLGAVDARVTSDVGDTYAVEGEYTTDERLEIQVDYSTRGNTGVLNISQENRQNGFGGAYVGELEIGLTDAVPMSLNVDTGVGDVELDLAGIQLESLIIDTGVGELTAMLPDGNYEVVANTGVGSLEIDVPDDAAVLIHYDGGIADFSPGSQFEKLNDNDWATDGYRDADELIEITINAGIGDVDVH